jgi:hypothetical protein
MSSRLPPSWRPLNVHPCSLSILLLRPAHVPCLRFAPNSICHRVLHFPCSTLQAVPCSHPSNPLVTLLLPPPPPPPSFCRPTSGACCSPSGRPFPRTPPPSPSSPHRAALFTSFSFYPRPPAALCTLNTCPRHQLAHTCVPLSLSCKTQVARDVCVCLPVHCSTACHVQPQKSQPAAPPANSYCGCCVLRRH